MEKKIGPATCKHCANPATRKGLCALHSGLGSNSPELVERAYQAHLAKIRQEGMFKLEIPSYQSPQRTTNMHYVVAGGSKRKRG